MHLPFLSTKPQNPDNQHHNPLAVLQKRFQLVADDIVNGARQAVNSFFHNPSAVKSPAWARIPRPLQHSSPGAIEDFVEERLAGVPVYALSNAAGEFVLVGGRRSGKSLGFFCFREEDAVAMLEQMKELNSDMREGSQVVPVALNKVFQLKVDGVAFRFIPDSYQVANAIKEKQNIDESVDGFSGVPVFQSRSLVLHSQNKRYRPVFFRKEDLEDSLLRASRDQRQLNPALRRGDIQVGVLEDIVNAMKGSSSSKWDDVVFIPPGFNVSTGVKQEEQAVDSL